MELEQKIGVEESLPPVLQAYVQSLLIKFSNIFFTDINLYNLEGTLYATSRPELYLQKIKAKRMHSLAFQKLKEGELSEWIQKENIGEFKYLSAYIPFKNQNNQTIAYLNIPYYAKEKALEEEIAAFLIPTINICLIVFTIALIFLLVINKQITRPLSLIRDYFKKLRLGNKVELIEWKSKDEIGELVTEYNKIAIELSESANELAKNERELAWREMAKQVAHEIKNPLTPMKLSVQHLQMAAKSKVEDLDDRIKRTTETLVNQIDALSNIASAFSSFASLPAQKQSKINLITPIQDAFQLYTNQAKIYFNKDIITEEAVVLGDRDQLLSVFNNLLKNAIQAKDDKKEELVIKIVIKEEPSSYIIEIADNGKGIDEIERERIFEPSFTTKTSGSGLGLSISKRIIENMQGEISFHSQENMGTTFAIRLPKAKD
jgi:nitrogen fixation/metabolism regulation signal transduction histidine kinase